MRRRASTPARDGAEPTDPAGDLRIKVFLSGWANFGPIYCRVPVAQGAVSVKPALLVDDAPPKEGWRKSMHIEVEGYDAFHIVLAGKTVQFELFDPHITGELIEMP